jgi:hypothetical protein
LCFAQVELKQFIEGEEEKCVTTYSVIALGVLIVLATTAPGLAEGPGAVSATASELWSAALFTTTVYAVYWHRFKITFSVR